MITRKTGAILPDYELKVQKYPMIKTLKLIRLSMQPSPWHPSITFVHGRRAAKNFGGGGVELSR